MRIIKFFKNTSGECPVEIFLDNLSAKQTQKITWVMRLIEELERIPELYFKKLVNADDIWEIRAQVASDIFRILGFFEDRNFIATNGFVRKVKRLHMAKLL